MTDAQSGRRPRPSLYDVAERAGVSHATVSRAVHGHPGMTAATRARVLDAVEEMGYTPDTAARALAAGGAVRGRGVLRVGIVLEGPDTAEHLFDSVQRAVWRRGWSVVRVISDEQHGSPIEQAISRLVQEEVDGLCLIAPRDERVHSRRSLVLGELPTVALGSPEIADVPSFTIDQNVSMALAVEHLVSLGHREIRLVVGPEGLADATIRARAGRSHLVREGLLAHDAISGDDSADFGCRVGADADALGTATAVIASSGSIALGVLRGLRERGVRVPDDVSVIALDDTTDSRHFSPPLTIIRQDLAALSDLAVTGLGALMAGEDVSRRRSIRPTIVVRASTAPPPLR